MTPGANDLCVFAVKRGDIEERIDVSFYHPSAIEVYRTIENAQFDVIPLIDLLDNITDGTHYTPQYTEDGVRFVSVTNIIENNIDFSNVKYISEKEHTELSKRCCPQAGDVLLTKVGSIGRAAVVPCDAPKFSIFVSVALLRTNTKIVPEYLCAYLNSTYAYKQFMRHVKGIGVPDLHLENIADTLIICPKVDDQIRMSKLLEFAFKSYKRKLRQADELLAQFEEEISKKYNLQTSRKNKLYVAIRLKDYDGVIDAKRYMGGKRKSTFTLGDVCDIVEEKENVANYHNDVIDWIRIDDLPNNPIEIETVRTLSAGEMDGTFFKVQESDILVARLGPTILNKKTVMVRKTERNTLASAEFLVLRCKKGINSEAVMAILKTEYYKDLMYSNSRGSTPSRYRLNREDALKLPFPDISTDQEMIANKAIEVCTQSKQLRLEAEQEWAAAKAQFEKELLGE